MVERDWIDCTKSQGTNDIGGEKPFMMNRAVALLILVGIDQPGQCPVDMSNHLKQGTLMIGYQPLPYKGLANFFRYFNIIHL